jgi:hypothetical protein
MKSLLVEVDKVANCVGRKHDAEVDGYYSSPKFEEVGDNLFHL